jgi:hypothetical protein
MHPRIIKWYRESGSRRVDGVIEKVIELKIFEIYALEVVRGVT